MAARRYSPDAYDILEQAGIEGQKAALAQPANGWVNAVESLGTLYKLCGTNSALNKLSQTNVVPAKLCADRR